MTSHTHLPLAGSGRDVQGVGAVVGALVVGAFASQRRPHWLARTRKVWDATLLLPLQATGSPAHPHPPSRGPLPPALSSARL